MASEIEHKFLDPNIGRRRKTIRDHFAESNRDKVGPPFFSIMEFNLSGLCNRKCVFCPRVNPEIFPNLNEHIPIDLYEKIMADLAEVSYDGTIIFSGFGEPLLYKRLEVAIELTKRYCPSARLEITTDGDFVKPEKLRSLFDAGLDVLLISMYDGPEQVEEFKAIIADSGVDESKVILRTRWLPPEEHYGITLNNRSGMVEIPDADIGKLDEPLVRPCNYPSYQVMVDYDGSVLLCPHDWGKKLIVGNLNSSSIHELWNSRIMKRVRLNLARADRNFPPCDGCDVDGTLTGKQHAEQWLEFYAAEQKA